MPVFELSANGKTFEVEAPDQASAFSAFQKMQSSPERGVWDKLTGATGPRYQTWPERAAREAFSLPERTMEAVKSAEPGTREFTANVAPLAAETAATVGMAPMRVGPTAAKGAIPTAEMLEQAGSRGYDAARGLGVEIRPESVSRMASDLSVKMNADGINEKLAPNTFSILGELASPPAGAVGSTISNMETVRRTLGNAAKNFTNPTEQMAAKRAMAHLDDYLASLGADDVVAGDAQAAASILDAARKNWGALKRSELVTNAADSAELSAAAANSGRNIGNAERQKFKSIALSDKKSAGFSPEELAQVERIVRGTATGNTARHIGNLLGGGGGMGQAVSSGAGALSGLALTGGNPIGAAVGGVGAPIVGNVARALSNASTHRQVRKLDEMVRQRSPLAEALDAAPQIRGGRSNALVPIINLLMQGG